MTSTHHATKAVGRAGSAPTCADIAGAVEAVAPPRLQDGFDNSGWQVGDPAGTCTGALLCVDATEPIVAEAVARGCNLIISHHPLIFHGLKSVVGRNRVERTLVAAIRAGVAVYSCHTPVDRVDGGVSWLMAEKLGLTGVSLLAPGGGAGEDLGYGVVGDLAEPVDLSRFVAMVKEAFGSPVVRVSALSPERPIRRVALCGGSGSEFLPQAIAAGADAYLTSDTRHNLFMDYADQITLADIGHFESEQCTKEIFSRIISEKFPNFALYYSETEINPINYL